MCSYSYIYYLHEYTLCRCVRTRIIPSSSRPGMPPFVMLMCGFFWRSIRNHYLFVLVMRALGSPIRVQTYVPPKFNKEMHYYYYTYHRGAMGIFFTRILFWDIISRHFGNNVLPSFILSTSPYIKIRSIAGEYRSKYNLLRPSRFLALRLFTFTSRCRTDKAG